MRLALLTVLAATISPAPWSLADDQRAKTEDGREVILKDDGTWTYADESEKSSLKKSDLKKGAKTAREYTGKRGTWALDLEPGAWNRTPTPPGVPAEVVFEHEDGEVAGMVIAERIEMPLETLKKIAVENARNIATDFEVLEEDRLTVNGNEVLSVVMKATVEGIELTYYSYYYTGDEGSIQVLTWTGQNLFDELKPVMEAFLNGFVTIEKSD